MNARVVAITDRTLCPTDEIAPRMRAVLAAVPEGALHVQIREKDLDGGSLLDLARALAALGAPMWVNDRLDIALAARAVGVHLPERGLSIGDARRVIEDLGAKLAIGCSRHAPRDVAVAADVVHLGPIWATPSKAGVIEPLGVDALCAGREILGALSARLVAVGGIDRPERAREAARAGADAVAVIRAVWASDDPARAVAALCEAVDDGHRERCG